MNVRRYINLAHLQNIKNTIKEEDLLKFIIRLYSTELVHVPARVQTCNIYTFKKIGKKKGKKSQKRKDLPQWSCLSWSQSRTRFLDKDHTQSCSNHLL